jgi:hypothetical protein
MYEAKIYGADVAKKERNVYTGAVYAGPCIYICLETSYE